ncbi:putative ubiquitin conjugating enzyme [Aspergillus lucknowensis]|uniref:Ubiquitin-conjugating enzyme E2 2 n=1 Tax=Aspergillus lucknowensis TaxID=176173 RepID=A0ABR4M253_9EURO
MTVSHLVRRGVEAISTGNSGDVPDFKVEVGSPWLAGLLLVTILGFFYAIFSVEYTYALLVPTLAAVEDSNPELYVRIENDPTNKKPGDPLDVELEVATAPPRPITSGLRTTIRHLRARAGRCSRFRGFSMFLTWVVAEGFFASFIPMSSESIIGRFIIKMASAVLLANLQVAWVHIVISEPSPKPFYRRIPSFRSLRKIVPAAAFEHLLTNGAYYVSLCIIKHVHGLKEIDMIRRGDGTSPDVYRAAANMLAIAGLVSWLASIPARAIFIRVAASLLPHEDEPIVPFDRTFGGKVLPDVVGGGVLAISDAWKTFDRSGWKRYIKAICKAFAIQFAVTMLFSLVLCAEIIGAAGRMLARQLQQMQSDKDIPGISCGLVDNNVFEWEVMLMISDDVKLYGGGFFRARLSFPPEYPHMPPKMKFESPLFHPNIYPNGEVCISILHPPEEDKYGYESAAERWSPVQTPETILLSVISMLSSPNDESPANVEAARLWRDDPREFKKRVRQCVRESLGEE